MKLLLALCLAICIVGAHCNASIIDVPADELRRCARRNYMTLGVVKELFELRNFSINLETKCLALCLLQASGVVDADGKVTDKFKNNEDVIDCQKKMTGTKECEPAAQLASCLTEKDQSRLKNE